MPSMKEIAKKAGVSSATVSRVFNNSPSVSPEVRERVLRTMEENGYRMNWQARNFREKRSRIIICFIFSLRNPYLTDIVEGLYSEADRLGYTLLLVSSPSLHDNADEYVTLLEKNNAEGVIFVGRTWTEEIYLKIHERWPVVFCSEKLSNWPETLISIDNTRAGFEATEFLIGEGCRRIGFLAGRKSSPSTYRRIRGAREAIKKHGLEYREGDFILSENAGKDLYPLICSYLDSGDWDGFLCNSDMKAALMIKALVEHKNLRREDIKLITFDGTYLAEVTVPSMSHIVQPMKEMGILSVRTMVDRLDNNRETGDIILDYSIEKRST